LGRAKHSGQRATRTGRSSSITADLIWRIRKANPWRAGLADAAGEAAGQIDWRAMLHYGVNFFMLENLVAVCRTENIHISVLIRGESLVRL
jgi:hypothetical protein